MTKIKDCYFMKYCTKKGFQKESFLKNLLSIRQKGLARIVKDNRIIRNSFFDENLDFLNSLIHAIKYYSDESYKNDKSSRRNHFYKYTAREFKAIWKDFPELKDLALAQDLKKRVFEESCIQSVLMTYNKPVGYSLRFCSLKEIIDYISSLGSKKNLIQIRYRHGAYVFVNYNNFVAEAIISTEDMNSLRKMNVLEVVEWSIGKKSFPKGLDISNNYLNNIVDNYKKPIIKQKMNIFSS